MKIIIGRGVNKLQILDRDGNDILGEKGLVLSELRIGMLPLEQTKAEFTFTLVGDEHEIEVEEANIVAKLERLGITKIEKGD